MKQICWRVWLSIRYTAAQKPSPASAPSTFLSTRTYFNGIPIDHVISPEQIVKNAIYNLIEFPGVSHVSEFAGGLVRLFSVKVMVDGFVTGKKIKELRSLLASGKIRIVAIFRQGKHLQVSGDATIETGDELFIVAPRDEVRRVLKHCTN